jgi:hypothetical protein
MWRRFSVSEFVGEQSRNCRAAFASPCEFRSSPFPFARELPRRLYRWIYRTPFPGRENSAGSCASNVVAISPDVAVHASNQGTDASIGD